MRNADNYYYYFLFNFVLFWSSWRGSFLDLFLEIGGVIFSPWAKLTLVLSVLLKFLFYVFLIILSFQKKK
jgi:hypothetical protein